MAVGPKVEIILAEIFNFYGKKKVHRLLSGSDAFTSVNIWTLQWGPFRFFYLEPERIRHRLCMDDLCCAFREMTNRLRSTLSKAKEQSNWLCLLQFYRNGIFIPCSADSPGRFADGLVFPDSGGGKNSKSNWKNVFEISAKYNKGNKTNDN